MKLLENGLIPVYEAKSGQAVSARDLHEFLESKQEFANWIKSRIDNYGFVENEDFLITVSESNGGRPRTEYILKIDAAKEIAMVENNSQGRLARRYFIAVEKKFKQMDKPKCIEDVLINTLQEMKNVKLQLAETQQDIQNIRDTIVVCPEDWRSYCVGMLRRIAHKTGIAYDEIIKDSYKAFDLKGFNLNERLRNRIEKAEQNGLPKYKIAGINRLDCIAEDKRMVDIYLGIIKELAVKHNVA